MTRLLLLLALTASLGACATSATTWRQHYTLAAGAGSAPTATPLATPSPPTTQARATLRLARIDAAPWLRGNAMHYRLRYRDGNRLARYANADWAAPPATLLAGVLRRQLAASGHWRMVLGPANPATADWFVRIQLQTFGQVFTRPGHSYGVLDATATVVAGSGDNALAQRHFHLRHAAAQANAAAGVQALAQASQDFAHQLQAWLLTTPAARTPATPESATGRTLSPTRQTH